MTKPPKVRKPIRQEIDLTPDAVLHVLETAQGELDKRRLVLELGLSGDDRRDLREILQNLEAEGRIARAGRRAYVSTRIPPDMGQIEITGLDTHGEPVARLVKDGQLFGPDIELVRRKSQEGKAPGPGDRAYARLRLNPDSGLWQGQVIRLLEPAAPKILGVFRGGVHGGMVEPSDRKVRGPFSAIGGDASGAKDGDLVLCLPLDRKSRFGPPRVKVVEVIGREEDPRAASILAIAAHNIPMGFRPEEEAEAAAAGPASLAGRDDLRSVPLITIDPEDARDHDDAVFAEPDLTPGNEGGHRVLVAIADVAHYVQPRTALDDGAYLRGNSVYFPDRVVHMLPERLSADLCSLREGETRPCLAVEMIFSRDGKKLRHRFIRGLMKSAAKLSYAQAQGGFDGMPDEKTAPFVEPILKPLWNAFQCMKIARDGRGPLNLASSEFRIKFSPEGEIASINRRESLEAHKLIEEMMIMANVCAAETLEGARLSLIYRIHDAPSAEKLAALSDFVATIGLSWAKGERPVPSRFNRLMAQAEGSGNEAMLNEFVLRTQSQAIYHPENIGHFGLNLERYAHFTSPIRRYADLIVHRALIRACGFGDGGLTDAEIDRLDDIAEHITVTERRAMAAEREANDRYLASFMAQHIGATFEGRITGVTKAGLFIRIDDNGADGLAPISMLGDERFRHDIAGQRLIGEQTGRYFRLGQNVQVRLLEATPINGGLLFEVMTDALRGTADTAKALRTSRTAPRPNAPKGFRRAPGGGGGERFGPKGSKGGTSRGRKR